MFFRLRAVIAFAIFFAIGLFTLSHYGINWDEPVHYIRGQAFLRFFMTGKKNYDGVPRIGTNYYKTEIPKDVEYTDDNIFRRSVYQYDGGPNYLSFLFFKKGDDRGHPPLNGIIASFFNYVFYQKLGVLGDIESYHLFIIVVSAALIGLVFFIVSEAYGVFAGIVAALSLGLYPLFFSESHFNIKDPVSASFISLTLYTFYKGVIKNSLKWILVSSIFAGLALGTKFNIFFAGLIILPWLAIYLLKNARLVVRDVVKILLWFVLLIVIAFGILYASWPFLWEDPIKNMFAIFTYYREIGYTESYQPIHYLVFGRFNSYPIQAMVFTTPLIILFFSSIGLLYALRKGLTERYNTSLFALFWFFIPILRVSLPTAGIYGGLRQIMEYIPAMAIMSGIGAHYIVQLLSGLIVRYVKQSNNRTMKQLDNRVIKLVLQLLIIVSFIPIALKLISIHPNENVYFNPLIGGLKGAKEKNFPDWGVTLGSPYKEGIDWINKNAEPNARLALVRGLLQNIPATQIRKDIYFSEFYYSGSLKKGEYLMEVIDYRWPDVTPLKREYIETLSPVYEVKVDGVTILAVWRNG